MNKLLVQYDVCCVCLNEQRFRFKFFLNCNNLINKIYSDGFNELVSCDSCGFYTHEGCYGIADTESKQSSNSIASTEPWFCNSCLDTDLFEPLKISNEYEIKLLRRPC